MKKFSKFLLGLVSFALAGVFAFAADVDLTVGDSYDELPYHLTRKSYVITATIDFSETARNSNDVHQVIRIPANTIVSHVVAEIKTATTNTVTADIGDTADDDRYFAAVALTNTAVALSATGDYLQPSNDTINVVLSADSGDTGEVDVRVVLIDTRR